MPPTRVPPTDQDYDQAPVGFLLLDSAGIIEACNQTAADLLGEGLSGRRFAHCVATEDRDRVYVFRDLLHRDGRPQAIDARLLRPDGTRFYARLSARLDAPTDRCRIAITSFDLLPGIAIIDSAVDAIISYGLDGIIQSWNPGAERLYGYTAAEMLHQPVARLLTPEHLESETGLLRQRITAGQPLEHYETVRIRKDGRPIQVSLAAFPLRNAEGTIIAIASIARDISPRKQIEEKVRYQADLLENVSDAIISTNLHLHIQSWNRAAEVIYGWQANEVLGRRLSAVIKPAYDGIGLDVLMARVYEVGEWRGEGLHHRRDGTPLNVYTAINPVQDANGQFAGVVMVSRDMTQLRQVMAAEREQRLLAQALRDTAMALSSTLKLSEVLDQFLISISRVIAHDVAQILLVEGDALRIVGAAGYGGLPLERVFPALRLPLVGMPTLARVVQGGAPVIVADSTADPGWVPLTPDEDARAYLSIPLSLQDQVIGLLNLGRAEPHFYDTRHAERAQAFANQAAVAIHNAQLHERARELAALEERQRLARDLHDSVSQMLFSSSIITQSLTRLWPDAPADVRDYLDQIHRLNRGALAEMRNLLMELRPLRLMRVELADLLRQLVDGLMGRAHVDIHLKVEGGHEMPFDVKLALYRITQEALNNIIKHAQAPDIFIHLDSQPEQVILGVRDNGRGFDVDHSAPGMGLYNMRERAHAIGASLQIISEIDSGTEVILIWMRERRMTNSGD